MFTILFYGIISKTYDLKIGVCRNKKCKGKQNCATIHGYNFEQKEVQFQTADNEIEKEQLNTCFCGKGKGKHQQKCNIGEFCRKSTTQGLVCSPNTRFSGEEKYIKTPNKKLTVCRSLSGCSCGTTHGSWKHAFTSTVRYCAFGQWCQPAWHGFECLDIKQRVKFICPLKIKNRCPCGNLAKTQPGKQCNLYVSKWMVNTSDNHFNQLFNWFDTPITKFAERNGKFIRPDLLASSVEVSEFPEFYVPISDERIKEMNDVYFNGVNQSNSNGSDLDELKVEMNDYQKKYNKFDLYISDTLHFDRQGVLQAIDKPWHKTRYDEYLDKTTGNWGFSERKKFLGLFNII